MQNENCLINTLKRLRTSSKEAVENIDSFSNFKEYMHVERPVQHEFWNLIKSAHNSDKPQLLLVCGSVGDGKSHLISYFKNKNPEILCDFSIHNDATESLDPEKTSIETLNEVLDVYSDDKLYEGHKEKLILAINLGTLTNFIDSEFGHRFTKLKEYITKKKILHDNIEESKFEQNSYFQYINFSDYHMYSLMEEGPTSQYIKDIIGKIANKDDENPFFMSYSNNCSNCSCSYKCPIKNNYDFIGDEFVQKRIIDKLIEVMIKEKVIISTRALLNFIYDILVDNCFENLTISKLIKKIEKLPFKEYIKSLTANILFTHKDTSNILEALENIDPVNYRSEKMDAVIIKLNNTSNLSKIFEENLDSTDLQYMLSSLKDETILYEKTKTKIDKENVKEDVIKIYLRLYSFMAKDRKEIFDDEIYTEYMRYLYYWNKGSKRQLKGLLTGVKDAIYKWNGQNDEDNAINMTIGKNQGKFNTYQKLDIVGDIADYEEKEERELFKFITRLILKYKKSKSEETKVMVDIDYLLYNLLCKVRKGYRPNRKDKNNFINFVDFIEKIQRLGSQKEEVLFEQKIAGEIKKYRLYLDDYNEYCFMER
nr:DNA phosphorothioation-dependent restriction protein DptF [Oceanirhabdus seepicola]